MLNFFNNKSQKISWFNEEYPVIEQTINDKLINKIINKFWSDKIKDASETDHYLLFMFRVRLVNDDIKTLTKLQKIRLSNKEALKSYISLKSFILKEIYSDLPIKSIVISWGIREFKKLKLEFKDSLEETPNNTSFHYFNKIKIPISTNISDYGHILLDTPNAKNIKVGNLKGVFLNIIIEEREGNKYHLIDYIKHGKKVISFEDKIISIDDDKLIRTIGSTIIEYENKDITFIKSVKKATKIKPIKQNKKFEDKFIAGDLETVLDQDNKMIPYLATFHKKDGKFFEFSCTAHKGPNILFTNFFRKLFTRINKNHKIYFHNLSGFDAFFLLRYLIKLGYKITPLMHSGKIISIGVNNGKYNFTIRDSNLLLLSSLQKLAISFEVDSLKGIFPFYLKDIKYKGDFPKYELFNSNKLSYIEYLEYKKNHGNRTWFFKYESIKYCSNDSLVLFQIINKFAQFIYKQFRLNINTYPTIPSLAFAIFRSKYLPKDTVPIIKGKIKEEIQLGYTGGSTDMFIPKPLNGNKIYAYDVNSLYPFVMLNNDYPVGDPIYFEKLRNRNLQDNLDLFGHFYVKVTTPLDLKHPILQLHHNNRTVAPLGSFEGWFFSEELKNALIFGYKIEIINGYLFDKLNLFKGFVEDLYNLRTSFPKNHPMNHISKIIMNSLYGRFGMTDTFSEIEIIDNKELKLEDFKGEIEEIIDFDNHKLLKLKNSRSLSNDLNDSTEAHNVNIAIASAVTAYARIHMSQFKNNPSLPNLYYTDTDSCYFDGPLDPSFISSTQLGKLKLEGIYDQALFLAPKVYSLKNESEEVIKIKGLTKDAIKNNKITIDTLELLLSKDHKLAFTQTKWFKNISESSIQLLDQVYTLQATENKRELIYNKERFLIDTKPILINNGNPPPINIFKVDY
jgi:hypothetical protein